MSNVSRGSVGGRFHTFNSKPEENYSSLHFIAHSCGAGKFMTGKVDVNASPSWKNELETGKIVVSLARCSD